MHRALRIAAALVVSSLAVDGVLPAQAEPPAENLQLQYAQAKLQLAQANLKRIEQINERLKRSVPAGVVAEFRSNVDEATLQVRQAETPDASEFDVWLRRAQSESQLATSRWKRAVAGNRRLKGTFEELDVERFRLRAEVARLQFARGQKLADAPRAAQLEWQVELLNNEVDRLKEERARATPSARYYPIYWW